MNDKTPSKADAIRALREARYAAKSSPPVATAAVLGELRTGDGQDAKAVGLPKGPATATNSADKRLKSSGGFLNERASPRANAADDKGSPEAIQTGRLDPEVKPAKERDARERQDQRPASPAKSRARSQEVKASGFDPDIVGSSPAAPAKPKFDRNEAHRNYMREYMRKRRAEQKEGK